MAADKINLFSALPAYLAEPDYRSGCFVDTSVLFSESYPLDPFNEECDHTFDVLAKYDVAIFTNVNVRAEFLENHRRVLIAECLIDILEEKGQDFDGVLLEKLKAHRTMYRRKLNEEKSAKMDVNQIKIFRKLLSNHRSQHGNGWELFCRDYLFGKLAPIWDQVEEELGLNSISLRSGDRNPLLDHHPEWDQAVRLMGLYGIGSSDAMIINMFLCSKISTLLTADFEMAECALKESKGKKSIFIPDSAAQSRSS